MKLPAVPKLRAEAWGESSYGGGRHQAERIAVDHLVARMDNLIGSLVARVAEVVAVVADE
jgi:hypothetical protein